MILHARQPNLELLARICIFLAHHPGKKLQSLSKLFPKHVPEWYLEDIATDVIGLPRIVGGNKIDGVALKITLQVVLNQWDPSKLSFYRPHQFIALFHSMTTEQQLRFANILRTRYGPVILSRDGDFIPGIKTSEWD